MVDVVSITALVISVVALVTTILQVLQQYFGSAEGYRRCAKSVMGKWANGTHRKFRREELRFEVIFETPVIFTALPTNDKGPIPNKKIYYIDGTPESYEATWTNPPNEEKEQKLDAIKRVHTADDERASWVTILNTLQQLESESRSWDSHRKMPPRGPRGPKGTEGAKDLDPKSMLSVGLQRKTRSWDFMPAAVYKPFATTTICHLVEMVAMLGMCWKTFDSTTWSMRAEGNGFILTSTLVHGLGIMVTFSITGLSSFQENRIIPSPAIKELPFGSVPSIFAKPALKVLNFGSELEINGTLELLGCSTDTIAKYQKKHRHIFSVSFEIIGMLASPVRIRGSNFKRLPNPTTDHFFPQSFSRCKLMEHFQDKINELLPDPTDTPGSSLSTDSDLTSTEKGNTLTLQLKEIHRQWKSMKQYWPWSKNEKELDADMEVDLRIDIDLREKIHDALDKSAAFLINQPLDTVCSVVSSHLRNVMDSLNNFDSALQGLAGRSSGENEFLDIYFRDIKPYVVNRGLAEGGDDEGSVYSEEESQREAIWCTLIFRMICWLLLHDFAKGDVKITPSDLKGSRMPVYIG